MLFLARFSSLSELKTMSFLTQKTDLDEKQNCYHTG